MQLGDRIEQDLEWSSLVHANEVVQFDGERFHRLFGMALAQGEVN
jgi:hypothetical protein